MKKIANLQTIYNTPRCELLDWHAIKLLSISCFSHSAGRQNGATGMQDEWNADVRGEHADRDILTVALLC